MRQLSKYLAIPMALLLITFFAACSDDEEGTNGTDTGGGGDVAEETGGDMAEDTGGDMAEEMGDDTGGDMAEEMGDDTGGDMVEDVQDEEVGPTMVTVTFTVDTNTQADNANNLAVVDDDTQTIYIAGNAFGNWGEFNEPQWDPRIAENALTSNGDGTYTLTVDLEAGTALEYKFLMAATDGSGDNGWANGEKDYEGVDGGSTCGQSGTADCACTNAEADTDWLTAAGIDYADMTGGLWEIANRTGTVPDDGSTEWAVDDITIEAWRDYASSTYNYYHSCD